MERGLFLLRCFEHLEHDLRLAYMYHTIYKHTFIGKSERLGQGQGLLRDTDTDGETIKLKLCTQEKALAHTEFLSLTLLCPQQT